MPDPVRLQYWGMELDHVFVCAPRGERDTALLTAAGFPLGARLVHSGQGTANAVFFFGNAYFELLWLHDEAETELPAVRPLGLKARCLWRSAGACPFGLALRGSLPEGMRTWSYAAPYVAGGIPIVTPRNAVRQPLVFAMTQPLSPVMYPEARTRRALRRVHIQSPWETCEELRMVTEAGLMSVTKGESFHMELEFEDENERAFRPDLPLRFR
ncbi:MAG: VOC family protein [Bryobacterales bacterium]|nr:VOC family protein [Bryobacterales bacterium]